MFDDRENIEFTDNDIVNAISDHLWHAGYGRIAVLNNRKIIPNDRGAEYFDTVIDDAMNILLQGSALDPKKMRQIKMMVENLHNHLVDCENDDSPDLRWDIPAPPLLN